MKVTIITATLNNLETITETITSVLSQDFHEIEHVIIDGSSSDGTLEIINDYKFKNKSVKLFSENDKGVYNV